MRQLIAAGQISASQSDPLSAFIWWFIPLAALFGAIAYVIWVTKFQKKFENQTERSVGKFRRFQNTFTTKSKDDEIS